MKKIIRRLTVILLFIFAAVFYGNNLIADEPPNPGGGPGTGDLPVGGSAPIGGGILLLMTLGTAYGAGRIFKWRK